MSVLPVSNSNPTILFNSPSCSASFLQLCQHTPLTFLAVIPILLTYPLSPSFDLATKPPPHKNGHPVPLLPTTDAMDAWEATKVVFDRVRTLDPDNASKIMGQLLIRDTSDNELIRLAISSDQLLHAFIATARANLVTKPVSPPSSVHGPLQPSLSWGLQNPGGGDHQSPFFTDEVGYDTGDAFYTNSEYEYWSSECSVHRRSFPLRDVEVRASKPCMFFARGYCKNGSYCWFQHGLPTDDATVVERDMAVMRSKGLVTARPQQLMPSGFPFTTSLTKGVGLKILPHHHQQPQRTMAAAMLLGREEMHRFPMRSPHMGRGDLIANSAARQIYMTFPADSTFSVEDASNYFSMYGPVQDVRIPYQKKRMFGFVAFAYAESVKIILSKGNPHFVCNACVLVKPYKEKGKVIDRKLHNDFVGYMPPTDLLDSSDPFYLQQLQIGSRMMYGNIANHETFLRRKLKEPQQEDDLHQAIELGGRQFMGLQLLDLKSSGHHLGSPMHLGQDDEKFTINGNGNAVHLEGVTIQDSKMNNSGLAMRAPAAAAVSATNTEGKHEEQQEEDDASPKQVVNLGEEEKREYGPVIATPSVACGFHESGMVEHMLPESPFASPTKASTDASTTGQNDSISTRCPQNVASSLLPPTSTLEMSPYNSCFFQVPRFSPRHEAIGL